MKDTYDADMILLRAMLERLVPWALEDPAFSPIVKIEDERKRAPRRSAKLLAQALSEMTPAALNLSMAERAEIDRVAVARGGISMGTVLARDGKRLARILARGSIRNDEEFYLVGTIADTTEDGEQRILLWDMLGAYEGS